MPAQSPLSFDNKNYCPLRSLVSWVIMYIKGNTQPGRGFLVVGTHVYPLGYGIRINLEIRAVTTSFLSARSARQSTKFLILPSIDSLKPENTAFLYSISFGFLYSLCSLFSISLLMMLECYCIDASAAVAQCIR